MKTATRFMRRYLPTDMARTLGAALCVAVLSQPAMASAQDRSTLPTLEDLIPDSAVENPEGWAEQGAPDETMPNNRAIDFDGDGAADLTLDALQADAPLAEVPEIDLPWPEELELRALQEVEPEDDIQFADNPLAIEPRPDLGFEVELTDQLVLALPSDEALLPERAEFLQRFREISTVVALDSDEDNLAQLAARAREDQELLLRLLRIYGYYGADILRSVGGISPGEEDAAAAERGRVRFDIYPGTQFTYGAIDLGNLQSAPDADILREEFAIYPGDPVLQDTIVDERYELDELMGESGYAFAKIDEPSLLIDHDRIEGDLTLSVEPGGVYNFGDVVSSNPGFLSSEHLADIARFEPGDLYRRSDELDLRRAILATGLVSSVTISRRQTEAPAPGDPGTVAMDVDIVPGPLRTLAGSIGYGTEEGFKLAASWEHRNLFPPEGLLRVRGILGTQEQLFGVTFRRNNWRGRDRVLTFDAYASTIDTQLYDARTIAVLGRFERLSTLLFQKPFTWAFGAEILATQERETSDTGIAQPRQTYFVAGVFGEAQLDTTDSLLNPTRGFRIGGRLAPEASRTNDLNSFYVRGQIDGSYYQPIGDTIVAAGRVRLASIPGAPLDAIAPSRRLYAGGGGSVRGYGYQTIGPRDIAGEPSGGRSLIELSGEARIKTPLLGGAVSVVPFIDAGTVSRGTTPDFDSIRVGVGIGGRYETGFGPIRVDVGFPLNPGPDDSSFAVYVGIGQAF